MSSACITYKLSETNIKPSLQTVSVDTEHSRRSVSTHLAMEHDTNLYQLQRISIQLNSKCIIV